MRPSTHHHLYRPSVPSLLLLLLAAATTAVQPTAAASNIRDALDVVLPRDPLAVSHLTWPMQEPPPAPPPPDGGGPHDGPLEGPPDDVGRDGVSHDDPHDEPGGPLDGLLELLTPDAAPLLPGPGSKNLQAFQEALGDIPAGPITESQDSQRRYRADENTFSTFIEAASRTCDVQANGCTTKANDSTANNSTQNIELSVDKCEAQRTRCLGFQSSSASVTTFPDQQSTTSSTTTTTTTTAATTTLSISSATGKTASMGTTAAPALLPPPPSAGPTGTQLINLGPDPQFPMFDLLCDM